MDLADECVSFLQDKYPDVCTILENKKYKELLNYPRHHYTNTYSHSVRVAVGAACLAKMMGASEVEAIRVGLLHDMCFVNYYERNDHKGLYLFYHPLEASDNADKEFNLSESEKKAIKAHMFPLAVRIPTSRVALSLTISDKLVAIYEGLYGIAVLRYMLCNFGLRFAYAHA